MKKKVKSMKSKKQIKHRTKQIKHTPKGKAKDFEKYDPSINELEWLEDFPNDDQEKI